jgi:uncharacterized repeat protein (TIGR01451 family)
VSGTGVAVIETADLAIDIRAIPDHVDVGENLIYSIIVTNNGPATATELQVIDRLPTTVTFVSASRNCTYVDNTVTCTSGHLAKGKSLILDITVKPVIAGSVTNSVTVKAKQADPIPGNNSATAITTVFNFEPKKVVLLLHGMNSEPSTWKDFVSKYFNENCPEIFGGALLGATSIPNAQGTLCYAVRFGVHDISGDPGLPDVFDGATSAKDWGIKEFGPALLKGDFSTFDDLGNEVKDAVQRILEVHPGVNIVLVGHSRGGLAARAFLQNYKDTVEAQPIVGLLTTGSPHKGSKLGRIYSYLKQHPRESCNNQACLDDWQVVGFLLGESRGDAIPAILLGFQIDIRRPTIQYLDPGSNEINALNRGVLPIAGISYGQIRYNGVDLGILERLLLSTSAIEYSVFDRILKKDICDQLSVNATKSILQGQTPRQLSGDGIVPFDSQAYPNATVELKQRFILHTDEPGRFADIRNMFCAMNFSGWLDQCKK